MAFMLLGICVGVYADETSGNIDNTSFNIAKTVQKCGSFKHAQTR